MGYFCVSSGISIMSVWLNDRLRRRGLEAAQRLEGNGS